MADNKLQSLTEMFNNKFFRIPDFQRGYSWGNEQLEDFWEDLINLKEDNIHYTGLLTVEPIEKKSVKKAEQWQDDLWLFDAELKAYYLIDGQQRLTTSIILINELLNKFDAKEDINFRAKEEWESIFLFKSSTSNKTYKSYIFGYEKDNPSDEYFKTKILGQKSSTANKVPENTLYTVNLKNAKNYFAKELSKLNEKELRSVFKKVTNKFKYNLYEISDELNVYVTFETMNNRGKSLSNLELLKNRLVYLSTLLNDDDSTKKQLRKDVNETWKTIYEYLGKNDKKIMNDDEFIRNHWIMYFDGYNRAKSEAYAKYLLNEKFTAKNVINNSLDFDEIKRYIDSLAESIESWFYLHNPQYSKYNNETQEWIYKLNRIGMSNFTPLFMASMTKCDEKEFLSLLKSAEQFIFLVFKLSQRPLHTKKGHFYSLANSLYLDKKNTTIKSVIENIELLTLGKEEEYYAGWFDLNKFYNDIDDKNKKDKGFYSWSGLKYFLFEYELDLQNKASGESKIQWEDFKKKDTIEHIYPQTPKDECWMSEFDNKYSKEEIKIIRHSLGNLVLLSQSKNSTLSNKCFEFKKNHTSEGVKKGFFNGSYSEIEVADEHNWTPKEIFERGIKMLKFLEKRWDITFEDNDKTDAEKIKLLGIELKD
jgi:uncharacterized protein with ParB-like and HNH nuclease domain